MLTKETFTPVQAYGVQRQHLTVKTAEDGATRHGVCGNFHATGEISAGDPPAFKHACSGCGSVAWFTETYPGIRYAPIQGANSNTIQHNQFVQEDR